MTSGRSNTASRLSPSRLRCAIYTRKSSEEGLDQSYNSLDAQRDACEAYVMSQTGEGWSALPTHYDDGGFSGGNMDRPGLKQLLADIAAKRVDVVVVYKVDRLTRSLTDFARIVESFDAHGVSFVSVTQAFNTTSSMGRLTLNVLLSFAQFEREVTGERIRDKIAASKKKGMWMGGTAPLGYRPHERSLVIDDAKAGTVRHIYRRYLELRSVHALGADLAATGYRSRPTRRTPEGGGIFRVGALYHLLSNRLYLGEIVHKGASYPGQHAPIIDRALFDQVAEVLAANRHARRERIVAAARAPLTGLLFDAAGRAMSPVAARNRHGGIYRYYVSSSITRGEAGADRANGRRVSAPAIEALVLEKLSRVSPEITGWEAARTALRRVDLHAGEVMLAAKPARRPILDLVAPADTVERAGDGTLRITAPFHPRAWNGGVEVVRGAVVTKPDIRIDRALVRGLARAHAIVAATQANPKLTIDAIGRADGFTESYGRRLMRLAFLAPDIQRAIVDGRQPRNMTLGGLVKAELPLGWGAQREMLGFG